MDAVNQDSQAEDDYELIERLAKKVAHYGAQNKALRVRVKELEENLNERDAETTRRVKELEETLTERGAEAAGLRVRVSQLEESLARVPYERESDRVARVEDTGLRTQVQELKEEKDQIWGEWHKAMADSFEKDQALDKLRKENSMLRAQLADVRKIKSESTDALSTNEAYMPVLLAERDSANIRAADAEARLVEGEARSAELEKRMQKVSREKQSLEESVQILTGERDARSEALDSIQRIHQESSQLLANLMIQVEQKEDELGRLRRALACPGGYAATPNTSKISTRSAVTSSSRISSSQTSSSLTSTVSSSRRTRSHMRRLGCGLEGELSDLSDQDDASTDEDAAVVQRNSRFHPKQLSYVSPIPKGRMEVFASLRAQAPVDPSLLPPDFPDGIAHFTKTELADNLGGNKQGLIVNIAKEKWQLHRLSHELGITGYLCPKLNQNPWCPYAPGKDGYMFVGLGGDAVKLVEPEQRALFVNVSEDQKSKLFFAGFYEVCKVEDVTLDEWNTIPDHVKSQYSQTTKDKVAECSHMSVRDIKAQYDIGVRRAPCRRLRFLGFRNPKDPSRDAYQALITHFATPPRTVAAATNKRKSEDRLSNVRKTRVRLSLPQRP